MQYAFAQDWGVGGSAEFSRPGRSTDNACVGAFNETFQAEYLNARRLETLAETWKSGATKESPLHRTLAERARRECFLVQVRRACPTSGSTRSV